MKLVIQRVKKATVTVDSITIGAIHQGLLVFLGIHKNDTSLQIEWFVNKLLNLRIFQDAEGKMNLSVKDIGGEVLVVSQFTLYADATTGRRPSFMEAASPDIALPIYEKFCNTVEKELGSVQAGRFAAHMEVELINDGPVTILL